jgi:hypothetical protein
MSEAQLRIVHELNVAFNADADWPRFYHENADLHMPPEWPEESAYRGKAGLEQAVRAWREGFDEYHWVEERLIDADGCIVGLYYQRGRTKGGGPWIDQAIGALFWFRGEKIIRIEGFFSWADALKAAGVDEQGPRAPATGS